MEQIYTQLAPLPVTIKAFVEQLPDGNYVIVINSKLNQEQQELAYLHELGHIMRSDFGKDLPCDILEDVAHRSDREVS